MISKIYNDFSVSLPNQQPTKAFIKTALSKNTFLKFLPQKDILEIAHSKRHPQSAS